ncbi:hypothetical protein GCM10009827_033080 [Dactylosporangium maewongense]|uniref:Secreted protein n=1 Tax=Dactylosporangium maewongense TaxID=634393 RepID=A0ABN2AD22_9ACTN
MLAAEAAVAAATAAVAAAAAGVMAAAVDLFGSVTVAALLAGSSGAGWSWSWGGEAARIGGRDLSGRSRRTSGRCSVSCGSGWSGAPVAAAGVTVAGWRGGGVRICGGDLGRRCSREAALRTGSAGLLGSADVTSVPEPSCKWAAAVLAAEAAVAGASGGGGWSGGSSRSRGGSGGAVQGGGWRWREEAVLA